MGYSLMQTVGTALVAYFIQYTILREVQQIVFEVSGAIVFEVSGAIIHQ